MKIKRKLTAFILATIVALCGVLVSCAPVDGSNVPPNAFDRIDTEIVPSDVSDSSSDAAGDVPNTNLPSVGPETTADEVLDTPESGSPAVGGTEKPSGATDAVTNAPTEVPSRPADRVDTFDTEVETDIAEDGAYSDFVFIFEPGRNGYMVDVAKDKKAVITEVVIPAYYNGLPVVIIGSDIGNGFYGCSELTSVYIPETVVIINENAFGNCRKLVEVGGMKNVERILERAFYFCTALKSIIFPDKLWDIGASAFMRCDSLETVGGLENVLSIGDSAFAYCDILDGIVLPSSVTSLGEKIFDGNSRTVFIRKTFAEMNALNAEWSGGRASDKQTIYIGDGEVPSGDYLTYTLNADYSYSVRCDDYYKDKIIHAAIPAYYNNRRVKNIADRGFFGCKYLTEIYITSVVAEIGEYAFASCAELSAINGSLSVVEICRYAFASCENLMSIKVRNSLRTLGDSAFSECRRLESVIGMTDVKSIGGNAFGNCDSLVKLVLPTTLTSLGDNIFASTSVAVYIRNTVEELNGINPEWSGGRLPYSQTVYIGNGEAPTDDLFGFDINADGTGYSVRVAKDRNAEITSAVVPEYYRGLPVTEIAANGFYGCENLTVVFVPETVTKICGNAFYGCRKLENIGGALNVAEIDEDAFGFCTHLESISLPSAERIGKLAFEYCYMLEIYDMNNVKSIGDYAFAGCESLDGLIFPATLEGLGVAILASTLNTVFIRKTEREMSALNSLWSANRILGSEIIYIGNEAAPEIVGDLVFVANAEGGYSACARKCNITNAVIPSVYNGLPVNEIRDNGFSHCFKLTEVIVPSSVARIGDRAFTECENLLKIKMPGVVEIDHQAFYCCYKLNNVFLPNTVKYIGIGAFYNCYGLTRLVFPSDVTDLEIGFRAFYNAGKPPRD